MANMKTAVAIRHVAFEDLGTLAPALERHGYAVSYREAGIDGLSSIEADLLVVLGGPIGAYEEGQYPFVRDEIELLERRLAAGMPTLGICLGAQLMARALGERVYPGPKKEIGWEPLILTASGEESCVRHVGPALTPMLHWHGDTFDPPRGATLLASTAAVRSQVFSLGRNALAFQCHPEITVQNMERWLIGHACEISQTAGISAAGLRAGTLANGPALERQAKLCFDEWLKGLAE